MEEIKVKEVAVAMCELSISKMKQWIELDDDAALRKKRAVEEDKLKNAKETHEVFVRMQDGFVYYVVIFVVMCT